nr:MAG TPA: hypothetical protein [Bacteriophage sp.]
MPLNRHCCRKTFIYHWKIEKDCLSLQMTK